MKPLKVLHSALPASPQAVDALADLPHSDYQAIEVDLLEYGGEVLVAHDQDDISNRPMRLTNLVGGLAKLDMPILFDLKSYTPTFLKQTSSLLASQEWNHQPRICSHLAQDARMVARSVCGRSAWSLPQIDLSGCQFPSPRDHDHMLRMKEEIIPLAASSLKMGVCDDLTVRHELITPQLVEVVHRAGGQIYAWTLEAKDHIDRLSDWGVDLLICQPSRSDCI